LAESHFSISLFVLMSLPIGIAFDSRPMHARKESRSLNRRMFAVDNRTKMPLTGSKKATVFHFGKGQEASVAASRILLL
jgi:hypothetical protein